ncbi:hypothetical protein N7488_006148 [Penicillium malachiteum]|nr:hypothetical protein N7488_006148 [Penicillium malachiteum]
MTYRLPGNSLRRERGAAQGERSDFRYLDAAATALTIALKDENIPHLFLGGYATSLIGGVRVTEDIEVIVGTRCFDKLLKWPQFSQSTDNRLIFRTGRKEVLIDLMHEGDSGHSLPYPKCSDRLQILSTGIFTLQFSNDLVDILHPSVLLTKLRPWHKAFYATRHAEKWSAATDLEDIKTILRWLVHKNQGIDFGATSKNTAENFLKILGELYVEVRDVRPLLALTLSADEMRSALDKSLV